jgi:phage protein D
LVFRYGAGNLTTLFSFDCQYGIREQTTDIVVLAWDDKAQRWVSSVIIETESGPDPKWRQGGNRMERQNPVTQKKATTQSEFGVSPSNTKNKNSTKTKLTQTKEAATLRNEIKQTLKSATQFRIAAGGTAIDVQVDRPFETLQDAANFALRWFRERQDHFLVGHGNTIGVETLRARQVHILDGLGARLSGAYYFVTVRHTLGPDQGYKCEFTARKVLD